MTPQERQLVDQLFDRLAQLEREPREAEAERAIRDGLMRAPNAIYALVQTALVQDEALRRASTRIEELQAELEDNQHPSGQAESGGFLERMRNTMFGGGSVPSVRAGGAAGSRDDWSSGGRPMGGAPDYAEGPLGGGGYGSAGPAGGGFGGGGLGGGGLGGGGFGGGAFGGGAGGGSFLGTAAAAAAGTIGGSLLLNSIRGMMGPAHAGSSTTTQSAADSSTLGAGTSSPWGTNTAADDLSRQAGVNDIGRGGKQDATADDRSQNAYDDPDRGDSRDHDDYDYSEDDDDDFDMV